MASEIAAQSQTLDDQIKQEVQARAHSGDVNLMPDADRALLIEGLKVLMRERKAAKAVIHGLLIAQNRSPIELDEGSAQINTLIRRLTPLED